MALFVYYMCITCVLHGLGFVMKQELGQGLRAVPQNGMSHIAMQKPVLTVKQQVNAVSKSSSQSGPQYIVTSK